MDGRDLWIIFNAVNCAVLFASVLIAWWRLRRAVWAQLLHAPLKSVNMMRDRNVAVAWEQIGIAAFFLVLGLCLIVVATDWRDPVPWFVVLGTAAFSVGWTFYFLREFNDYKRMERIADVIKGENGGDDQPAAQASQSGGPSLLPDAVR